MNAEDGRQGGKRGGSIVIITVLRMAAGLSRLLRVRSKTYSNMTDAERTYFSDVLDDMREELRRKDREL